MENKEAVRVLQINMGSKVFGGVSSFLYNVYKKIDRQKVQFDFLSPNKTTYGMYQKEIEKMGGKVYELNIEAGKIKKRILLQQRLNQFLKENPYSIVHINSGSLFFNVQVARIAKKNHVKKIIIHSHNGLNPKSKCKNAIIKIFRPIVKWYATDFFACSMLAAEAMFPKKVIESDKFQLIHNGIEVEKFMFHKEVREQYRKELGIENKLVIGHVGRFCEQKNHKYLIKIFYEIYQKNKNVVLLLAGEGPLQEKIEEEVKQLGLQKNVLFLGQRKDVPNLLQAFDYLVLPSLYEGLVIVGIEAQCTGLPIIVSDTITKELKLSEEVTFLSIKDNPEAWAKYIIEKAHRNDREKAYDKINEQGYNINQVAIQLQKIYNDFAEKENESAI